MTRRTIEQFRAERAAGNERIAACDHLGINRFMRLDAAAYESAPGGLDGRTKELLGLTASLVLRCNDCVDYHLEQCVRTGWSRAEIVEAMHVGLVVGGSIVIPHLRHALATLDELPIERGD